MSKSASHQGKATPAGRSPRGWSCAALASVCALVIGIYAWSARSGGLELLGAGASDTYYNLLVDGFRSGHLSVKREAPAGLVQLPDPCDPAANSAYRWRTPEPLHDLTYYKGKLYLYFGPTPALLLFWPYVAATGNYLWHKNAAPLFFSAGFLASVALLWALRRRYFPEVNLAVALAGVAAIGLVNFAPAVLQRCDVQEVAISCGYALMMLALAGIWAAVQQPRRRARWLAAASLAYGLALGARPSLLLGAMVLLIPVFQAWREKRLAGANRSALPVWSLLIAAMGPIVLIGIGLMLYNVARFDSPLEFGQRTQLSAFPQSTMHQFSLSYLLYNIRVGWWAPAQWSGRFPFVHDVALPPFPSGYFEVNHPFGILTNIPMVWLALLSPLAWRKRSGEARLTLRGFLVAPALLSGMLAATIVFHNSMCLRYELEFVSALVFLAVVGIFGVERLWADEPTRLLIARCGWVLLVAFSIGFNVLESVALSAEADANLGQALMLKGKVDEAAAAFERALEINPADATARMTLAFAHYKLGQAAFQSGQIDRAIEHYQASLKISPGITEVHNSLATVLLEQGRVEEAVGHYQTVLAARPDLISANNNLAWVMATSPTASVRNGAKAVELALRANQLAGDANPMLLRTLAAACAEAGRFTEAIDTARRALALATARSNTAVAGSLEAEIKFYEAGSPLRDEREIQKK